MHLHGEQRYRTSTVRLLARNFAILFTGNVVGQVTFFVATLLLARLLGPSAFGVWGFAQAWQLYLLRLGEFGFEVTAIREATRKPEETPSLIGQIVYLRLAIGAVLFACTVLLVRAGLVPHDSGNAVLLFSVTVFPAAFMLEWVFEAKQNVLVTGTARVAKGILFAAGILLFVKGIDDFTYSVLAYVLSVTIPILVVFVVAVQSYGINLAPPTWGKMLGMIRNASAVGLANILSHYSLFVGTMIVGYLLSKEDLGLFSAAHRIVVLPWAYVIVTFQRVLLPALTRWFVHSREQYAAFVERFFRFTVIASLSIGVLGTLFGPLLMLLFYSSAYGAAAGVFVVLLWALALAGIRFIFEIALVASDCQKRYLRGMILLAVTYTVATPLLATMHGIIGAAWAAVIAESLYLVYLLISFPHMNRIRLLSHMWKPLVSCVAAMVIGGTLNFFDDGIRAVITICIFVGLLVLSKAISFSELRSLIQLLKTRPE